MENSKKIKNGKWKTGNKSVSTIRVKCCRFFVSIALVFTFAFYLLPFALRVSAQEQPPAPSAPKAVSVPAVKEKKLPNGLTIAVAERKNVPLVTVQLLIRGGASLEALEQAGLANMTADLLTKGTKTRTATQIAEQMEFLGGSISTGADWNKSVVTINVMSDKLDQAMAIMADVVMNPTFKQDEIDLLKSQTLDGLAYSLKQPGFLSNYVANVYSFDEHPSGGTPESIKKISRKDIVNFKRQNFAADDSVLIFTGDISPAKALILSRKFFSSLRKTVATSTTEIIQRLDESPKVESNDTTVTQIPIINRILVVDLVNSGQTSVSYTSNINYGRSDYDVEGKYDVDRNYFPALVLNSILGGGYSSRLNQEIRIKRGLSYGAGSSFAWRNWKTNFATRTQTKDVSAAEVAELVLAEVKKLGESSATVGELISRKSVLTGNFGRNLETNEGLTAAIADLYSFDLPTSELNSYTKNVQAVYDSQVRDYAKKTLVMGDIIIVGDYAKFKDDLAKRFPNMQVEVVKADELDLSKDNLRK